MCDAAGAVIRVLHVDDAAAYRLLVGELLDLEDGIEVVGEAADAASALERAATLRPDVLLLDLVLDEPAEELVPRLREVAPDARIVLLSGWPDDGDPLPDGVSARLGKAASATELAAAVRDAAAGRIFE